jgi:hypothetical protein
MLIDEDMFEESRLDTTVEGDDGDGEGVCVVVEGESDAALVFLLWVPVGE